MYRIKFTRTAQIERAPKDKRRGGFDIELIPAGTVMTVNAASLNFWRSRGCIQELGRVEPAVVNPFEALATNTPLLTKAALRRLLELVVEGIADEDVSKILAALKNIPVDAIDHLIEECGEDARRVLVAAVSETSRLSVDVRDLADALEEAIRALPKPRGRPRA